MKRLDEPDAVLAVRVPSINGVARKSFENEKSCFRLRDAAVDARPPPGDLQPSL
jgi:hypothetical protein